MKIIQYTLNGKSVELTYSLENETTARRESSDGQITILEISEPDTNTIQSDIDALLIDHEYRITLLEFGITESEV